MRGNQHRCLATMLLIVTLSATGAKADPCGMVPPIYIDPATVPIERVGLQKTFVFYKDGLESLVIRPGFTGKVEEFGMLIPFPTPPAIRKVADDIFPHIAAAIDPPEVVIDLRRQLARRSRIRFFADAPQASGAPMELANEDAVTVIREEAVGMYEVVVLDAGSAKALKRWMDDHEYRYPEGMDAACEDYVKAGWCFVAVRTQVGHKSKVDPKPGQKEVDTRLAPGVSFDGHVQAMGFRFSTEKLVVPMRLSTFNKGDLHNVVYVLTDRPSRINHIPEKYVVRQVEGAELFQNLTGPLPLRIIGGAAKDIQPAQRESLKTQRNPEPHNGLARGLFASDLVCAVEKRLSNDFEETEKDLLKIGEFLNMRGPQVDVLHRDVLKEEQRSVTADALVALRDLTLTVIDGDFPRDVLARDNLTFSSHRMPKSRNAPSSYDARSFGPAPKQDGTVIRKSLAALFNPSLLPKGETIVTYYGAVAEPARANRGWLVWLSVATLGTCVLVGWRRRWGRGSWLMLLAGMLIVGVFATSGQAQACQAAPSVDELLEDVVDKTSREAAIDELRELGEAGVDALADVAASDEQMTRRGWAVICLSEIGGEVATKRLQYLAGDGSQPLLVRTWCAAALYQQADTVAELIKSANGAMPLSATALHRPFQMRLAELLTDEDETDLASLLQLSSAYPFLNATLVPAARKHGTDAIIEEMLSGSNNQIRSQAAAVLGAIGGTDKDHAWLAAKMVAALKFDADGEQVPWHGGPLFLPGLTWNKKNADEAMEQLLTWWLWCERKGLQNDGNIIANNLWVFTQSLGMTHHGQALNPWLVDWARKHGSKRLRQKLELTGVTSKQQLVDQLLAIESASEPALMKVDGGWRQVAVLQREGKRVEIVHLDIRSSFREWVRADRVAVTLPSKDALKKASVDGKYSNLLHIIESKDDFQTYQQFSDYGFWSGKSYAGHQNLQPGYWVYAFPNWYVWKKK